MFSSFNNKGIPEAGHVFLAQDFGMLALSETWLRNDTDHLVVSELISNSY